MSIVSFSSLLRLYHSSPLPDPASRRCRIVFCCFGVIRRTRKIRIADTTGPRHDIVNVCASNENSNIKKNSSDHNTIARVNSIGKRLKRVAARKKKSFSWSVQQESIKSLRPDWPKKELIGKPIQSIYSADMLIDWGQRAIWIRIWPHFGAQRRAE